MFFKFFIKLCEMHPVLSDLKYKKNLLKYKTELLEISVGILTKTIISFCFNYITKNALRYHNQYLFHYSTVLVRFKINM